MTDTGKALDALAQNEPIDWLLGQLLRSTAARGEHQFRFRHWHKSPCSPDMERMEMTRKLVPVVLLFLFSLPTFGQKAEFFGG